MARSNSWRLGKVVEAIVAPQPPPLNPYVLAIFAGFSIGLICLISPLLSVAAVVGVVFFIIALTKPIILCYMLIPAIALTSGMERGRLVPLLKPGEAGLVFSVAIVFFIILANKQRPMANLRYGIIAFVLYIPGLVFIPFGVYLLRGTSLAVRDIFWLVAPLQYFLLFFVFAIVPEREAERRRLVLWMLICASIVAIVGLAQAAQLGPAIKLLKNWYPSDHLESGGRLTSLMGAWNSLGILLMSALLISWAILPTIKGNISRGIVLGAMGICAVCLIGSGSFAGIGGVIMGVGVIEVLWQRGVRIVPIFILSLGVVAIIFLLLQPILQPLVQSRLDYQFGGGSTPQTLSYRFIVWRDVFLPPIRQNFPWPVHPTVPASYTWHIEESQYIMLLFRLGLTGLLSHLAWVGLTLAWLSRRFRQSENFLKGVIISVLAILIVLTVDGLTNAVFTFAGTMDYLWILLGLIANSQEIYND